MLKRLSLTQILNCIKYQRRERREKQNSQVCLALCVVHGLLKYNPELISVIIYLKF